MKLVKLAALGFISFSMCLFAEDDLIGKPITIVREKILANGWKPRETYLLQGGTDNFIFEKNSADAGIMYKEGFIEVESCTGVAGNYCFFNYEKNGRCLRIETKGQYEKNEYEPTVFSQTNECPEKDILNDPSNS